MTQNYPEATVGALIIKPNGEILLAKSSKWNNRFTVPGGHIELGERAEVAIKREVKEETGLEVDSVELLFVQQAIYPKDYQKHQHFVFLDYVCRAKDTQVKLDGRELQEFVWVKPEHALELDIEEYTRNFILKFISYREGQYKPNYS
jgi:nucleoside triphosphatase